MIENMFHLQVISNVGQELALRQLLYQVAVTEVQVLELDKSNPLLKREAIHFLVLPLFLP